MSTKLEAQSKADVAVNSGQEPAPRVEGFDPYSRVTSLGGAQKPRRTLDDMRKLSEEIKRNRGGK
ncbi:MAG: hypothetical protein ACJ8R9_25895 [Steroidobacteraceae bacterium]